MHLKMQPQSEIRINYHLVRLPPEDPRYPKSLKYGKSRLSYSPIMSIGNLDILKTESLAMFCSQKCPGQLILQTYDLARSLREAGITVIGGFHSSMERECLSLLLRGHQPVIICPARSIQGMRLPSEWNSALAEGRLLLLSNFKEHYRRPTATLAQVRNEVVSTIANVIFVAHAAAGGKTERFCQELLARKKPLVTLENDYNAHLIGLGARPIQSDNIGRYWHNTFPYQP